MPRPASLHGLLVVMVLVGSLVSPAARLAARQDVTPVGVD